jgi:hypothetical protein
MALSRPVCASASGLDWGKPRREPPEHDDELVGAYTRLPKPQRHSGKRGLRLDPALHEVADVSCFRGASAAPSAAEPPTRRPDRCARGIDASRVPLRRAIPWTLRRRSGRLRPSTSDAGEVPADRQPPQAPAATRKVGSRADNVPLAASLHDERVENCSGTRGQCRCRAPAEQDVDGKTTTTLHELHASSGPGEAFERRRRPDGKRRSGEAARPPRKTRVGRRLDPLDDHERDGRARERVVQVAAASAEGDRRGGGDDARDRVMVRRPGRRNGLWNGVPARREGDRDTGRLDARRALGMNGRGAEEDGDRSEQEEGMTHIDGSTDPTRAEVPGVSTPHRWGDKAP